MLNHGAQTFVKICGITRLADARVAIRAGANAVGFVFAPSPRRVGAARVRAISSHLHPAIRRIGVFVDVPPDHVLAVADEARLDGVQLQGSESLDHLRALKSAAPQLFILKVIRRGGPQSLALGSRMRAEALADAVMVDTKDPADLTRAPETISVVDLGDEWGGIDRLVLAGGLTPGNVGALVREIRPWGVDVSAGVESAPGRKDADKVRAFVRAVREAETETV
ncbi:MAG: phosphoribosylanthranilate isomerase [Actinomycetota bacterium]